MCLIPTCMYYMYVHVHLHVFTKPPQKSEVFNTLPDFTHGGAHTYICTYIHVAIKMFSLNVISLLVTLWSLGLCLTSPVMESRHYMHE